ncbi:MAG: hypothetical protein WBD37_04030 [Anderseniella sp.]
MIMMTTNLITGPNGGDMGSASSPSTQEITALLLEAHAGLLAVPNFEHLADDLEVVLFQLLKVAKQETSKRQSAKPVLRLV